MTIDIDITIKEEETEIPLSRIHLTDEKNLFRDLLANINDLTESHNFSRLDVYYEDNEKRKFPIVSSEDIKKCNEISGGKLQLYIEDARKSKLYDSLEDVRESKITAEPVQFVHSDDDAHEQYSSQSTQSHIPIMGTSTPSPLPAQTHHSYLPPSTTYTSAQTAPSQPPLSVVHNSPQIIPYPPVSTTTAPQTKPPPSTMIHPPNIDIPSAGDLHPPPAMATPPQTKPTSLSTSTTQAPTTSTHPTTLSSTTTQSSATYPTATTSPSTTHRPTTTHPSTTYPSAGTYPSTIYPPTIISPSNGGFGGVIPSEWKSPGFAGVFPPPGQSNAIPGFNETLPRPYDYGNYPRHYPYGIYDFDQTSHYLPGSSWPMPQFGIDDPYINPGYYNPYPGPSYSAKFYCNNCQLPISRVRYKCLGCPDYDLCGMCESQGIHSHHNMVRLPCQHRVTPRYWP